MSINTISLAILILAALNNDLKKVEDKPDEMIQANLNDGHADETDTVEIPKNEFK